MFMDEKNQYRENEYICVYTYKTEHFAVEQKLIPYCKSTILQ